MIISIDSVNELEKSKLIELLNSLNLDYNVFEDSWDCYVTEEMKRSVPIYYSDKSESDIENLVTNCIDVALEDQDELLSGDDLLEFIKYVEETR